MKAICGGHKYIQIYAMWVLVMPYIHTYIHTYIHIHTCINIYTYIHEYIKFRYLIFNLNYALVSNYSVRHLMEEMVLKIFLLH